MAAVTLTKRTVRGFDASLIEGTDDAILSSIARSSSGAATLWGDDNATTINIGGGAANTAINIGIGAVANIVTVGNATGATLVDINSGTGGITLDAQATASISLTVATDNASEINFSAHGQQHAFNSLAQPTLLTVSQTLVGAINEGVAAALGGLPILTSATVNQAHTFDEGEPIYHTGSVWASAKADASTTTADAIVVNVADANNFTYTTAGDLTLTTGEWDIVTGDSGGLTAGEVYWLNQNTAGLLTTFRPNAGIAQPLLKAISTTVAVVFMGEPHAASGSVEGELVDAGVNGFRMTLTSGTSVTTSDVTGATTVYLTPHLSNRIALQNGSSWSIFSSAEVSLDLTTGDHAPLTSGKNYDVFAYDNSDVLTLELSVAWTNDTTRDDAISQQDGVYVLTSDTTRRYVGTIRTTSTTTTEDSEVKRFVFNVNNRVHRSLASPNETTDNWTYTLATFRQANASTANQVDYVSGLPASVRVSVHSVAQSTNTAGITAAVGIGIDSTSANSAQVFGNNANNGGSAKGAMSADYAGTVALGYHFLTWLEISIAGGTTTWFGDNGVTSPTVWGTGIMGTVVL